MIKSIFTFFFLLFGTSFSNLAFGQFEGKLFYEVSYLSDDKETLTFIEMLPKESTLSIKDTQMRLSQSIAGGGSQAFITNSATNTSTLLMRFMGQEFQVKLNESELMKLEQTENLKIVEGTKTKVIADHKCLQSFAIQGSDTLEIYYAPELQTNCVLPQFADLKGIPLQYEVIKGKLRIAYSCKSISKETVADDVFSVDPKIKEIPFEQFAKSFAIAK